MDAVKLPRLGESLEVTIEDRNGRALRRNHGHSIELATRASLQDALWSDLWDPLWGDIGEAVGSHRLALRDALGEDN